MAQLTQEEINKIEFLDMSNLRNYKKAKEKNGILQFVRGKMGLAHLRLIAVCGTDETMSIEVDQTTDYGTIKISKKE